jgi:hypothetical protein
MGIANERIITIPLAADAIFHPRAAAASESRGTLHGHGIVKPFVLFTGNGDFRRTSTDVAGVRRWRRRPRDAPARVDAGRRPRAFARMRRLGSIRPESS